MVRTEIIERRLRIASFLFVVAAIVITFTSFVLASKSYSELSTVKISPQVPVTELTGNMLVFFLTERFVTRCLFIALFFMQLGIVFLLYLLLNKIQTIEQNQ